MTGFAELVAASHFSFLAGASAAEDLVLTAVLLGHAGLGIADRNSVAGVVRAHVALRDLRENGMPGLVRRRIGSGPGEDGRDPDSAPEADVTFRALVRERAERFRLATGARLVFADTTPDIVAHPLSRAGWGQLCSLLTLGNRRARKGACHLTLDDLVGHAGDLALIVLPGRSVGALPQVLARLREVAPDRLWLGARMPRHGDDRRRLARHAALAAAAGVPLLATNDVLYADPAARDLQDVLTCIRAGVTITGAGRRLEANAERHLKSPEEMARLFADCPAAVAESLHLMGRIRFGLDDLTYEYPDEPVPPGRTPQDWLEELTWRGATRRYPDGVPGKVVHLLRHELALIARLGYARYFLTIHDIVVVARDRGILCQGRGSAANSAVCYVLGITAVDPLEHDLLFARFISEERREPPDIDVDFEHERREEVIQHIYARYGRERAGLAATVIRYRPRSAIRDVGKALGLSADITGALAGLQWGSWGSDITRSRVRQAGLDPDNPEIARAVGLARRLLGFPRHLSQHVGGFILTRGRLDELVPIGNAAMADRTFIEWDKDDIEALRLMKVDVLALGMLTCIRKAFALIGAHEGLDLDLSSVPQEDPAVYDMLCRGESIGVFQVESRAQINMLPRLRPRCFYDLVIEVAIVRPGPIQGDMVHPYLRRRSGREAVVFPSPSPPHDPDELKTILGRTLGVPLFQEQAMKIAMVAAEFSDIEANQLRRAMATFRHLGTIGHFETLMVERMIRRGYDPEFARRCFEQIKGFGSYGFPESHAASFAKLVYVSSWLKCHHPAAFACALLNSQPMGFYAPAQIVRDARDHGVPVLPVDINHSDWDNGLERTAAGMLALRLGLRQVGGMTEAQARRIVAARGNGYGAIEDMARRAWLHGRPLRALADADAFASLGLSRRVALWEVRRMPEAEPLPLFAAAEARELGEEPDAQLAPLGAGEEVATDYQTLRLSLKGHPMQFLRATLVGEGVLSAAAAATQDDGAFVRVAGLVLVRQRPGKGNAVFITLEDETGILNIVLWASDLERFRRAVMGARLMQVAGRIQQSPEGVIHLMARHVWDRSGLLDRLWDHPRTPLAETPPPAALHPRNVRMLPRSRDFH